MRYRKWMVFGVTLGLIAGTAGWLGQMGARIKLEAPGVKVSPVELYQADGSLVSNRCVVLPEEVPGFHTMKGGPTPEELTGLPADTTFGRNLYANSNLEVQLTVVLMGTDHTSIHQPQYCLTAQNWNITNSERIVLHIHRPHPYDMQAVRITASQASKSGQTLSCNYVYWFVSAEKITAEEGARLRSMWKNVLRNGIVERWAYISYFSRCLPGQEAANLEQLQKFIETTVPEIQTVAGEPVATGQQHGEK
jgi:hypothetical protein